MKPAILTVVFVVVLGHMVSGDDRQQAALSNATSTFGQRLNQKIARDKKNVVFSPYTIHALLSLTYLGARNETAKEMSRVLSLESLPGPEVHVAYRDLILKLKSVDSVELTIVKAVFLNPNKSIEEQYKNEVKDKYFSKVAHFSLSRPEGPEKAINDWILNKTEGLTKDTIPRGSIDANTAMVLVSTICFNGTWQDPFDESRTQKQDFNQSDGSKIQVDMMNDTRSILLKRDNESRVDVAELPFKGGRFSLYIVKPHDVDGIADLEERLKSPEMPKKLFEGLSPSNVQLGIPKFKIETKIDLKDHLRELGMEKATTPRVADFSGISKDGDIFISKVIHQAVIDVNEVGTSAAAVTALEGKVQRSGMEDAEEEFIANRPFMYFLWDNETKHSLFQGKFSGY